MKTLYDKLSESNKKKLENNKVLFPTITGNVIDALKNNTSWLNLTFGEVIDLMQLTSEELSTITNVDNLFTNEK